MKRVRFFGHDDSKDIVEEGFNGKMTEIHAALGLANLKYLDEVLNDRKRKYLKYKTLLQKNKSLSFQTIKFGETNYSYFPVIFESEEKLLEIEKCLAEQQIYPRRYFYPSVNTYTKIFSSYQPMPVSEDVSKRILCLPLYWKLQDEDVEKICEIVSL